ncbi:sulfatase-like hydrolase/transferase [Candidatus Poribacteria bacterium]|jgi:arylsulfatase A-like enzyme|nr:sulfatase-like hydrolase/transferase [Candidatus Poribacteria bacterium]MBT5536324.1 sulfatase-like hydrolase/transferase [Candidatus Poribacteria bacterium]MBT5713911.1 sulfatase-like hydrolase/transferase [Candidatus Poribacteria bacterium]MBT7095747.1 sulfatase-like hydrolase/transferase [Candidatus Poribacteria bacterium]MBT7808727.1 sulfatase-like hydrolase/transferase [Candidatus Poribacteria bacterium]
MASPNILFITTDQQRADHLGCAGNPVLRTPHIDRLATEGTRFDRCHVNNPLCMPSRATMMTGRNPRSHGVWCNGVPLPSDETTVPALLTDAGYATALIGKAHFTPWGSEVPDEKGVTEHIAAWNQQGVGRGWHGPYYGFQHVDLALGHGNAAGHYRHWLEDEHPDALHAFGRDAALEPPTGTPQAWKSALPVEAHSSTYVADRSVEYMRHRSQEDAPFFLWASFPDPHHPYSPPAPYCDMYAPDEVALPTRQDARTDGAPNELLDKPPHYLGDYFSTIRTDGSGPHNRLSELTDDNLRETIALTYGMMALVDDSIGRMWAAMDELGLWENTLVVYCSDHGDLMGDHWLMNKGPFHYDGLLRVPCLARAPGGRGTAGQTVDSFAQLIDLPMTFLDYASVEPAFGMQGRSLRRAVEGSDDDAPDAILVENSSGELPHLMLKTVQTREWKMTVYAGQEYGELYDLRNDPHEFRNLWRSAEHGGTRAELRALLLDLLVGSEDRLPRRLCHA